jgi:hypothetical protein
MSLLFHVLLALLSGACTAGITDINSEHCIPVFASSLAANSSSATTKLDAEFNSSPVHYALSLTLFAITAAINPAGHIFLNALINNM